MWTVGLLWCFKNFIRTKMNNFINKSSNFGNINGIFHIMFIHSFITHLFKTDYIYIVYIYIHTHTL